MSYFITLEGPEGGGKSTQARMLAEYLRGLGYDVRFTREPGGTPISDQIRAVLTNLDNTEMHPCTEFLLFSAARAQHVRELIRPHLERGGVVVCDRYFDSSLAYQGFGHGLNLDALREITRYATHGLVPDLTLLLDIPSEEGLGRRERGGNWNRLDAYELEFHCRVRQGYHDLAAADPERWVTIDASRDLQEVQESIRRVVDERMQESAAPRP